MQASTTDDKKKKKVLAAVLTRSVRLQLTWGTLVCRLRLKIRRRTPVTTKALQLTNSKK